ncbi:MAG: hypothetical protein WBM32_05950 [Crocosphaera sp.]
MAKKQNFRKEWQTLTELGTQFGVSARKFGSMLKEFGLRESTGEPSETAIGFYKKIEPKNGKSYYLWSRSKIIKYFAEQGINPVISNSEAIKDTEARKLARDYLEARKLDEEGNKLGYLMFQELMPEIKKIGVERFKKALKSVGYKEEFELDEGW